VAAHAPSSGDVPDLDLSPRAPAAARAAAPVPLRAPSSGLPPPPPLAARPISGLQPAVRPVSAPPVAAHPVSAPPVAAHPVSAPVLEAAPGDDPPKLPSFAPPPLKASPKKAAEAGSGGMGSFDDLELQGNDFGSIDLAGDASPPAVVEPHGPPSARAAADVPVTPPKEPSILQADDGGHDAAMKLADYGDPPTAWWNAPLYAYHVMMRQQALKHALVEKRASLAKARTAADDAVAAFAERGRKVMAASDAYSKKLGALTVAEHGLREKDGALASESDAHAQKIAGFDERIAALEAELAAARAEEKAHSANFVRVDDIRQRADAMVKRAEIDLRNAVARLGPSAVPGVDASAADPTVAAKTAERDARKAELAQAMPAVLDLTQTLTVARRKVTAAEEKVLAAKNERAAVEAAFKKRGAAHGAVVAKAQEEVRAAMAALGRAALNDHASFGREYDELRKEIAALDKVVSARDDDVELHVLAMGVHDRPTVKNGIAVVAAAVGLLIALMLLPLLFVGGSPKPPPQLPATVPLE